MTNQKIILKPGKERSLRNFHPWVFSGAIKKLPGTLVDGDVVDVYSNDDEYLATGHYNNGSITVRLFSFNNEAIDAKFWEEKIKKAYTVRQVLNLVDNKETNTYRLVHGEGDGLPGLIIDIYNDTAVVQSHNMGMHKAKAEIVNALKSVYGKKLKAIYDKSSETMPKIPGLLVENGYLFGSATSQQVLENKMIFNIDWVEGQKTGFFVDQRDNRQLLAHYAKGKTVLNTFCYSGGFSIAALKGGALKVDSNDSSKKAIELTDKNVELNGVTENHQSFAIDTFEFLKTADKKYDLIVLDPPAFAKHLSAVKNAAQGYQRLNREAFIKIKPNSILFTFSCSQVIDKDLFRKIVFSAAAQAGRNVRILHQLSQPADHPINIYHPEGEYLKGLVLFVE